MMPRAPGSTLWIASLLALSMTGCSDSDPSFDPCGGKACGDSCKLCAPGDDSCAETSVEKFCQPDGSCRAQTPSCGETYRPCAAKACGDSCTICAPDDPQCNETGVEKFCQPDGSCSSQSPSCDYDPCAGKACGDPCSLCAPDDPACNEDAVLRFCQTDGSCSAETPACAPYDPCGGKACGDSCTICAPDDAQCNETGVEKYCQPDGSCSSQTPSCGDGACGDDELMALFAECRAAQDSRACIESGGEWTTVGLSEEPTCLCPTGQGDCVCHRASDCLGACTAPMSGMDFMSCAALTEGTCTPHAPSVGCRCWFDDDGAAMGACAD